MEPSGPHRTCYGTPLHLTFNNIFQIFVDDIKIFAINSTDDYTQLLSDICSISCWLIANLITLKIFTRGTDKSLDRPGGKQATATKLGDY
jgi:hypothetical protein